MTKKLTRLLAFVAALTLSGVSIMLGETGFDEVLNFRQLERIPLSGIADSVGGESQLRGQVASAGQLLTAPKSGQKAVYYDYLKERRETDSNGNTRWRTVDSRTDLADFQLSDVTGDALVNAAGRHFDITITSEEKFSRREGDYRYTEWRIDPGDTVTIFGWVDYRQQAVVNFSTPGEYQPIISSLSAAEERSSLALSALLFLWGGISCLLLACFALLHTFKIHKTLIFLVFVSLSSGLLLFHYGYRSVVEDVSAGHARVVTVWQRADDLIRERLTAHGMPEVGLESAIDENAAAFDELSETEKRQLDAWRLAAEQVRARYLIQISRFPDSFVAAMNGINQPPAVALRGDLQQRAADLMQRYQSTRISDSTLTFWGALGLLAVTVLLAWISLIFIRVKRMQENIPTSKTAGLVYGMAEIKGKLIAEDADKTLRGPVSGEPCTWYRYVVKEKQRSGKRSNWVTIEDVTKKQPFYCEDDEGRTRVFPGKAECISQHRATKVRGRRKYIETRLSPGDELYILGKAKPDKTQGDSLVFIHEKGNPYIIANIPEEDVMFRKAMSGIGLLTVALSALFLGAILIGGGSGQLSSLDFLLASLLAPVFMFFVVFMLMYNDLIFLRQRCDRNWANIQVSLKKRADLVPQVEQLVKELLSHEQDLQVSLAKLREQRGVAETVADVDSYLALEHQAIDSITARIEAYPDLKGIDMVGALNRRLIKLENEISLIRAGFNDAVTQYETRRATFPDNLLAKLFRFKSRQTLRFTDEAHRIPPVVSI
ncbi:MAG: LemA family protein [Gammaproteobacteria bacterium]